MKKARNLSRENVSGSFNKLFISKLSENILTRTIVNVLKKSRSSENWI